MAQPQPNGNYATDMNADNASHIYQDVVTEGNTVYTLSLFQESNGNGLRKVEVYWNGVLVDTMSYTGNNSVTNWVSYSTPLPATGIGQTTSRLEFKSIEPNGSGGMLLDNVRVVKQIP